MWVVYDEGRVFWEDEPLAHGFAESSEAAKEQAEQQVGPVAMTDNCMALHWREKTLAFKRMEKKANTSDTSALEFVYKCRSYDSDYSDGPTDLITPYRIVKMRGVDLLMQRLRACP